MRIFYQIRIGILLPILLGMSLSVRSQFPSSGHTENTPRMVVDVNNASYYGGAGDEEIRGISIADDGSIYFVGKTSSSESGSIATSGALNEGGDSGLSDAFIVKMRPDGVTREWAVYYGGSNTDEGNAVFAYNNALYVVGTKSYGDHTNAFIAKFNSSGGLEWEKEYGGTENNIGKDIIVNDNGVYVLGDSEGISESGFLLRLNTDTGEIEEEVTFQGQDNFTASSLRTDDNGDLYISGILYGNVAFPASGGGNIQAQAGVLLAKTDENGEFIWARSDYNLSPQGDSYIAVNDNHLIFGGNKQVKGRTNISIFRIDESDGSVIKQIVNQYGGAQSETLSGIVIDDLNNITITGTTESNNLITSNVLGIYQNNFGGETDALLTKFDIDGNTQWSTYFGATAADQGLTVTLNSNGGIYVGGMARSNPGIATSGGYDDTYNGANDGFFSLFHDLYIIEDPSSQKAGLGETITFSAEAEGSSQISDIEYRWYYRETETEGWTMLGTSDSSTLVIDGVVEENEGYYKAVAYSPTVDAIVHTNSAYLQVLPIATVPATICLGESTALTVADFGSTSGISDVSYSWSVEPSGTAGIKSATNTNNLMLSPTYAGEYTCTVTVTYKDNGEDASLEASSVITVTPIPHIVLGNSSDMFCSGTTTDINFSAIFQYNLNDSDPNNQQNQNDWLTDPNRIVNYSWSVVNNANIEGATNGTINTTSNSIPAQNIISQELTNKTTTDQSITYNLGISLVNGCATELPVTVTVWGVSEVEAGDNMELCLDETAVLLTGYSPADAVWSGNGIEEQNGEYYFNLMTAGVDTHTITLTVTDANNCESTDIRTVTVHSLPELALSATSSAICSGSNTSINITSSSKEITYKWSVAEVTGVTGTADGEETVTDGNFTINQPLTNNTSNVQTVVYVVIPISNGCEGEAKNISIQVYPQTIATLDETSDNIEICEGSTYIINAENQSNATYQWYKNDIAISDANDASLEVSAIGFYKVDVTVNGCTNTSDTFEVTTSPLPVFTILSNEKTDWCSEETIQTTLSANITNSSDISGLVYKWTNSDGDSLTNTSTLTVNNAGIYTLTITTDNGCQSSVSQAVTQLEKLNPLVLIDNVQQDAVSKCNGDSVLLTVTPYDASLVYTWVDENDNEIGTGEEVTVKVSGEYKVNVTKTADCIESSSVATVTVNELPQVSISTTEATDLCKGEDIDITLTASSLTMDTYQWYKNGVQIGGAVLPSLNVNSSGQYTLFVTKNECQSAVSNTVEIIEHEYPTASFTADKLQYCEGDIIRATFTAHTDTGTQYQWQKLDGSGNYADINGADISTYTATESGTYRVNIISTYGCLTSSEPKTVEMASLPSVSINSKVICEDGFAELIAQVSENRNDITYKWTNLNSPDFILSTNDVYYSKSSGVFVVEAYNSITGCSSFDTTTIQMDTAPPFNILGYDEPTCDTEVKLYLDRSPLSSEIVAWYKDGELWKGDVTEVTVTESGIYKAVITNSTACDIEQTINVLVNNFPEVRIMPETDTLHVCKGEEFELSYSSDRPVSVVWSTTEKTSVIRHIAEHSQWYALEAEDAKGCKTEARIFVSVHDIDFDLEESITGCGEGTATDICIASGFSQYKWVNEQGTVVSESNCLSATQSGRYTVTVSNEYGCETTKSITLNQADEQSLKLLNFPSLCEEDDYTTIEVSTGFEHYYWNGSTESTGATFTAYELGTYTVKAVTKDGCEYFMSVDVIDCCGPRLELTESQKGKTIVFTPFSTPGQNDIFILKYKYIDDFEMRIFSRWGNEVFYTTNPDEGWDGRVFEKAAPSDVYQVVINFTGCENQQTIKKTEVIHLYLAD